MPGRLVGIRRGAQGGGAGAAPPGEASLNPRAGQSTTSRAVTQTGAPRGSLDAVTVGGDLGVRLDHMGKGRWWRAEETPLRQAPKYKSWVPESPGQPGQAPAPPSSHGG